MKKAFVFTGGEIVNEIMVSTGYLPGAHDPECPVYWQIARLEPPWTKDFRKVALVRGKSRMRKVIFTNYNHWLEELYGPDHFHR